jgi:uncharacterized protein (UPF0261 family)
VTTPCVNLAREVLESRYGCECLVFHATGHGGRAMERLVDEGRLDAVLDLTTTEVCDLLMGGNMSAGPGRLEAGPRAGIPYVVSLGATDMVNFGPRATVPERYQSRQLLEHNAVVTLMRTTADECRRVGSHMARQLRAHAADETRIKIVVPRAGVSVISTPGAPFADAGADAALYESLREGLQGSKIELIERDEAINEEAFARCAVEQLASMLFT